ncbi:hypothetical protein CEV31_0163 [Brucella thiophenivorans]|uniref:Uncharacterized protein n=1 Tax=Brucella thiophenivorans TaxID=571255 RepID=A0A256G6A5_9HYPH|nr:hypothetical protein CEV31_0163 [Brucella thiophenivorans]
MQSPILLNAGSEKFWPYATCIAMRVQHITYIKMTCLYIA